MSAPATIRQKYTKPSLIKKDIVDEVQEKLGNGLSHRKATEYTHAVLEAITEVCSAGKGIEIRGFGTFKVTTLKAKTGRNPKTGEEFQIPAHKVLRFKPSNLMRAIIAKIPV